VEGVHPGRSLLVDIIFNVKAGGELEQEHKDIAEIKARLKD